MLQYFTTDSIYALHVIAKGFKQFQNSEVAYFRRNGLFLQPVLCRDASSRPCTPTRTEEHGNA